MTEANCFLNQHSYAIRATIQYGYMLGFTGLKIASIAL